LERSSVLIRVFGCGWRHLTNARTALMTSQGEIPSPATLAFGPKQLTGHQVLECIAKGAGVGIGKGNAPLPGFIGWRAMFCS
jgi:hypothetical protein